MGDKTRIPLADAEALALEAAELLRPACATIAVAGSIRRGRPDVGDIELVCVPLAEMVRDLFDWPVAGEGVNALDVLVNDALRGGRLAPRLDKNGRRAVGQRYKRLAYKGFALDVFAILPPASFGSLYVIRTGPGDFSHALVTPSNELARDPETRRPLCPGLCPPWLQHKDGRFVHRNSGTEYPTPTEPAVFELLGLDWLEPEQRAAWIGRRIADYAAVGAR